MRFSELRDIITTLGGEARMQMFDDGYTIYARVPFQGTTEFMRYSYVNGDATRPEDRILAGLTLMGLLEDNPSVDTDY